MNRTNYPSPFAGISADALDRMLRKFRSRVCRKGERLFEQGKKVQHVVLLLEGDVEVFYTTMGSKPERVIGRHTSPAILGSSEIWHSSPTLASVRVVKSGRVIELTRLQFLELLHSNHQFSINILQFVSSVLCDIGGNRRLDIYGQVEHVLANTICTLAQMQSPPTPPSPVLIPAINKTKLAESLGVTRQSVIRGFASLARAGLIESRGKDLLVKNLTKLQHKAWDI